MTYTSDDTNTATVARVSDLSATVTGVAAGTVTITAELVLKEGSASLDPVVSDTIDLTVISAG